MAQSDGWAARLREPSVEVLLEALAQPHAAVREGLGPHRLRWSADFSLGGAGSEPPEDAALDAPAVLDDAVHDELELRWTVDQAGLPRMRLHQANDHDRGREIILVDGHVHWRDLHRPWQFYPVESDLHERWLDEAQHGVHDVVQLAAPRLRLDAKPSADGTIALELGTSDVENGAHRRDAQISRWRAGAEIERVSGRVVLDASGAWRSADVTVQYALQAADGRTLRGSVHLEGEVEPLPPEAVDIRAPNDSEPLEERTRLHEERRELLDGLAAPR
jgi:hypothetical protein